MIGYRFLSAAEEEMSEAAEFYETATVGLGRDYLEDIFSPAFCLPPSIAQSCALLRSRLMPP